MDRGLVAWGRAVKRRRAGRKIPPLWLFSDADRTADLLGAIGRLPPGLCGVVFRHDADPARAALGARVARLCRARRLALVVAGDARLAARLKAGVHRRGGRRTGPELLPRGAIRTASAHDGAQVWRARGVDLVFISPVFPTRSHPGAAGLGVFGWLRLARLGARNKAGALGGMRGENVRRLGAKCLGLGAIAGILPAQCLKVGRDLV